MKNYYKFLSILVTIIAFVCANITAQVPVAIDNGGFENTDDPATNWNFTGDGNGAIADYEAETSDIVEGSQALKVIVDAVGTVDWDIQMFNTEWAVEKAKSYRLSIWVKNPSASDEDTIIYSFTVGYIIDAPGGTQYPEQVRIDKLPVVGGGDWRELVIGFVAPFNSNATDSLISQSNHYVHTGTYLVDNLTILQTQFLNAVVAGDSIVVSFIPELGDIAAVASAEFTVTVNDAANAVTSIEKRSAKVLSLKLTDAVTEDDEVVIEYTPGNLVEVDDVTPVAAFEWTIQEAAPTGINNTITQNSINAIYPNPAKELVNIDVENVNMVQFFNTAGQLIKTVNGVDIKSVNISGINSGLYFITISTVEGNRISNHLIVE